MILEQGAVSKRDVLSNRAAYELTSLSVEQQLPYQRAVRSPRSGVRVDLTYQQPPPVANLASSFISATKVPCPSLGGPAG